MMGKKEKIWLIRIEMLQLLLSIFEHYEFLYENQKSL